MKTFFYFFIVLFIVSCTDNEIIENGDIQDTFINSSDPIPIRSSSDDSISNIIGKRGSKLKAVDFLREVIWTNGKGKTTYYEADEFLITKNMERFIYPGSVLSGKDFEKGKYKHLSVPIKPITISTSLPADIVTTQINNPNKGAIRQAVRKFLIDNGVSGKESLSFSYNMSQYSYYEQLKLAFSSNINVASVFDLSIDYERNKLNIETAMIVKFTQQYYDITMDFPDDGSILKNTGDFNKIKGENPIYVSSVTYGRLGVMSIQSTRQYEDVSMAIKAAFKAKVVNGNLSITYDQKTILESADIKIFIISGEDSYKTVEGYDAFQKFIIEKGVFSADAPGVPIYFTASTVNENAAYYSVFKVDTNY